MSDKAHNDTADETTDNINEEAHTEAPQAQAADQSNDNETEEQNAKPPRSDDVTVLDKMIDDLEEKLDKVMRAYADADNRAKRAEKDRSDSLKYGITKMANDLLDVADNLERALSSLTDEQKEQLKDVIVGLELTEKSLHQTFERHGIKPIITEDVKFDPANHEAITKIPDPSKQAGDIIDVTRKGYHIGDRLLRAAQVVICA